ncbi:MarR family winged helix-turn-helix transcriptional regulator [Brevibacterium moorei]|jgi:DNA-binding MarR family transcriptional regulator|uniref:MarR family winged helix-turn-helix transcriptional regulator n=1 Tax=Brevibacterium moorei TaxID=2968457 RepID=UPI00211BE96C|nr:winged helix DNA-binding protein [Brevibacterium sp. 68QC2CO]MCQ9386780.1 winged helix DNA-binding protein [Brevibacterium sp. 68QC2CO]
MPDLAYVLHDLVMTMDEQAGAKLRPFDLTMRKYVALTIIAEHPGVASKQVAASLRVTEAAMSGLVRSLGAAGLVVDAKVEGAGRAKALRLTARGTDVQERATAVLGRSFDDVVRAAGQDPQDLADRLQRITAELLEDPGA